MGKLIFLSLILLSITGCSTKEPPPQPLYRIASDRFAAEPVYGREKTVAFPVVKPDLELIKHDAPLIMPVYHLSLKEVRLDEVASLLAAGARYSSTCSDSLAQRKISMEALGNIDELAEAISKKHGIKVRVDHKRHHVSLS